MRPRDLASLEYSHVLTRLAEFAVSESGREACAQLRPTDSPEHATRQLERTRQCLRLLERHGAPPLDRFDDIRAYLDAAGVSGYALDGTQLVAIRRVLRIVRAIAGFLGRHITLAPDLADLLRRLPPIPALEEALTAALDDAGEVLDSASPELARTRRDIRLQRESITSRLEDLTRRRGMADIATGDYVTVRHNRYVIPVRASTAARLNGVVQDRSASGETLFVEPLFAVELNNRLLLACKDEERLVQLVLAELTEQVSLNAAVLQIAVAGLIELDVLLSRAKFAQAYRCTMPRFSAGAIKLHNARHPVLLFGQREVIPIELLLDADRRSLVITGPNTGGKTVALKTLGLFALMAQTGLLLSVDEGAELPFYHGIFADVGDEQSIERNLSTFSAHIENLREILILLDNDLPDHQYLVLLDEPGVGTDPEEGSALAIGLLQEIEKRGAHLLLTTHYSAVKFFALNRKSCRVAAVGFDLETFSPLYDLTYDSIGRSMALPIARRLGLAESVLAAAEAVQTDAHRAADAALARLDETRQRYESKITNAQALAASLEREREEVSTLREQLRRQKREAWRAEIREARETVRQIREEGKEILASVRANPRERARLEKFVRERSDQIETRAAEVLEEPVVESTEREVRVGDTVEVENRNIRGELLAVDGDRAWLQSGAMRVEVQTSRLRVVKPERKESPRVRIGFDSAEGAATEINLIGMRAREAIDQLSAALDRAVRARIPSMRIVHGYGTGALRRAVQDFLAATPYGSDFRSGGESEGGTGVTIVQLGS